MKRRLEVKTPIGAALCNIALAYVAMMLTRVAFFLENYNVYAPSLSWSQVSEWLHGALVFDTSALLYVNALYLVLVLFPLHLKERQGFHRALRWIYVVTNSIAVASNLIDTVYFQYTGRRSTLTVFSEFASENNIASIILTEVVNHWYLTLTFIAIVALLWLCYTRPRIGAFGGKLSYYVTQVASVLIAVPLVIIGIRGSVTAGTRPITVSNANQYVGKPVETALVLNTPFSMIRTAFKKVYVTPSYFPTTELEQVYSPIIIPSPADSLTLGKRNIVVLIVESMSKEYVGSLNHEFLSPDYKGYMPFIDSLATQSLTYDFSFANGRISMDAMPSILAGIPMFVEPFFLTSASLNEVHGLPHLLAQQGYNSAFFHGGHNISMGFSAFAHAIGYDKYYGLDEYCANKHYGGMDDFDGKWAIWDEPFLQFTLDNVSKMSQPFLATVFTASSHHPYHLPPQYRDSLRDEGGQPIHKCVRYTDLALQRFFERAQHEPWYNNTIFVIVADHTNLTSHPECATDLGVYRVPIIFFTPDGALKPQLRRDMIAQQTDITPTLLHLVGYDKPYLAFGCDLLSCEPSHSWAVNYNNGTYQYLQGDYLLQFNGERTTGVYNFKRDIMLSHNLNGTIPQQGEMERTLRAIIQQYMARMNENRLTP